MTSQALQLDLRDAGRDGLYAVAPDDPPTLADDAARAGLRLARVDLRDCAEHGRMLECLARAFEIPPDGDDWETLTTSLREADLLPAAGHVLLLDHADVLRAQAPAVYLSLRSHLLRVARDWHDRGVPFFVFLIFADGDTSDTAVDA